MNSSEAAVVKEKNSFAMKLVAKKIRDGVIKERANFNSLKLNDE